MEVNQIPGAKYLMINFDVNTMRLILIFIEILEFQKFIFRKERTTAPQWIDEKTPRK